MTRTLFRSMTWICCFMLYSAGVKAVTKTTLTSGSWSNPAIWSPAGVPVAADDVIVDSLHVLTVDLDQVINRVDVRGGGTLTWTPGMRLTLTGNFTVNGTANMNGGNITLSSPGLQFNLGPRAVFSWDPGTNDAANATLFGRGIESFATGSHLIIRRWYNYAVPLGSLVSGQFGHLTINSPGPVAGTIAEWNQSNWFQLRRITGTLTIDQGWVTLDRSGAITSTSIGSIVLTSVNSVFYGHSGTHPSSFTIATSSITNNGGTFIGLQNGNGNVTVHVSGNFTNIGNVKIINNSGVSGVSNGNAVFNVIGTFTQNTGDTRVIYNIATTNSGTYRASFGNLIVNDGIFFGQTGCHAGGQTNVLQVGGQLTINFSLAASKFRGASLSSIGPVMNNAGFELTVGGNLSISGPAGAEFTSSAASGPELIRISGRYAQNGTTTCFNFGTNAASHAVTFEIAGNLQLSSGFLFLSRNGGTLNASIQGDLVLLGGQASIKGHTGIGQLAVTGNYTQSGGHFVLHNNATVPTADVCQLSVSGAFTHSSGTFEYENCTSGNVVSHLLLIQGSNINLSGTGIMTSSETGTGLFPGVLRYARNGSVRYARSGTNYSIQQVRQEIDKNCLLEVATGPLVLGSHQTNGIVMLEILTGGTLVMGDQQVRSNKSFAYSFIQVDSAGTFTLSRQAGLYDHDNNGTIDATADLSFSLHPYSVVVYNGVSPQDITGTDGSHPLTEDQYYGILRIQIAPTTSARLQYDRTFVRTRLELTSGVVDLDGKELLLMNGDPSAIVRTEGGISAESNSSGGRGRFIWQSMTTGLHEFPFVNALNEYVPVRFTPISGMGGNVSIGTQKADQDNRPLPATLSTSVLVVTASLDGASDPSLMIDRWWEIDAPGFVATLGFSYSAVENTLPVELRTGYLGVVRWNGSGWTQPTGSGMAVSAGVGFVQVSGVNNFGTFGLVANTTTLPIELVDFNVRAVSDEVQAQWTTASEVNNDYFSLERSQDGIQFEVIQQVDGAGNSTSMRNYACVDKQPFPGVSYYRLRQTDYDGKSSLSEIRAVNVNGSMGKAGLRIDQVGPNPFDEYFRVFYSIDQEALVQVRLLDGGGRPVSEEQVPSHPGSNTYEFRNGSNLPRGTYIIQFIYQDEISSSKLIRK